MEKSLRSGLVGLLGAGLIAGAVADAKADGWLNITNKIGSSSSVASAVHFDDSAITDGYDPSWDLVWPTPQSGTGIYSEIPSYKLAQDYRRNISAKPYKFDMVYGGTLSNFVTNYLYFSFPFGDGTKFENETNLTLRELDTNGVPTTNAWNVFNVILNQNGVINAGVLPAGTYNSTNVIKSFQLDFNPIQTNSPPTATNSVAMGSKAALLSGSFLVSGDTPLSAYQVAPGNTNLNIMGTNWTFNPHGVPATNIVPFYASNNVGTSSVANLTLVSTNTIPVASSSGNVGNNAGSDTGITLLASDADNDPLTFSITSLPTKGYLTGSSSNLVYHSYPNQSGWDSFVFKANDGYADSLPATNSLYVYPVNYAPQITGIEDLTNQVRVTGLAQNNRTTQLLSMPRVNSTNYTVVGSQALPDKTNAYSEIEFIVDKHPTSVTNRAGVRSYEFFKLGSTPNN